MKRAVLVLVALLALASAARADLAKRLFAGDAGPVEIVVFADRAPIQVGEVTFWILATEDGEPSPATLELHLDPPGGDPHGAHGAERTSTVLQPGRVLRGATVVLSEPGEWRVTVVAHTPDGPRTLRTTLTVEPASTAWRRNAIALALPYLALVLFALNQRARAAG